MNYLDLRWLLQYKWFCFPNDNKDAILCLILILFIIVQIIVFYGSNVLKSLIHVLKTFSASRNKCETLADCHRYKDFLLTSTDFKISCLGVQSANINTNLQSRSVFPTFCSYGPHSPHSVLSLILLKFPFLWWFTLGSLTLEIVNTCFTLLIIVLVFICCHFTLVIHKPKVNILICILFVTAW